VVTNQPDWVVEVGANIGAFLMDVARRPNVSLLGFEPSQACVNATEQTMLRNSRGNCRIFPQLVGETTRLVAFDFGRHNGSASVLTSASAASQVEQTRLGDSAAVMKIPTWRWAKEFIRLVRPLIVLEYNFVSKRNVHRRDIEALLGDSYNICQLRTDGFLDSQTDNAWNCVAVPVVSVFEAFSRNLIKCQRVNLTRWSVDDIRH